MPQAGSWSTRVSTRGSPSFRRRNWEPPDLDPASLDAVVVTHAHLDHSGYLPRLVRDGFTGRIVCTPETAALVAIVLRDSAHLQAEDATYANSERFSKHRPALPLYDLADVERTLPLIQPTGYAERVTVGEGIAATLRPAGHILGSATALVEVDGSRVLFSGDLGRPHHPLLPPPADPPDGRRDRGRVHLRRPHATPSPTTRCSPRRSAARSDAAAPC